jgi:anion-transporting  ArsA/GET3 family ATPase
VVVAEVGGQARVPRLLDGDGAVSAVTLDVDEALGEWLGRQLPGPLARALARSGAFGTFVGAAPGARELVTIYAAWALGESFDTVVLDAPASGHGVGLLRTPRTFAEIARVGPIARQAREVAEALADPAASSVVAVALPSELAVAETLELEGNVAGALGRGLDAIVVNGMWPRRVSARDAAGVDGPVGRAMRAAAGRVREQQAQLARLRREAVTPVLTLPFVFAERLDPAQIRAFSARLERAH